MVHRHAGLEVVVGLEVVHRHKACDALLDVFDENITVARLRKARTRRAPVGRTKPQLMILALHRCAGTAHAMGSRLRAF